MDPVTIIKKRRIPTHGTVNVVVGEKVTPDTLIAKGSVPSQDIRELKLYRNLNIDPGSVKDHVTKQVGESVEKDEVVAIARSFFGRQTKMARSPIDGTIEAFSATTGRMMIKGNPIPVEVFAHIPGVIKEILREEGATIETSGYLYTGLFGVGGETHGELAVVVESGDTALTSAEVRPEHRDKIIVGGSFATLDALREAVKQGVRGIIVGGVDQKDLTYFLGYEIGLGVTGSENLGLTLILTEGFGVNPIPGDVFDEYQGHAGKLACIDGTTHIRSRSQRPEIIIPL